MCEQLPPSRGNVCQCLTIRSTPLLLNRRACHLRSVRLGSSCSAHFHACWTDNWGLKAARRKYEGSGRMRYMKNISRRFKNGFREGTSPPHIRPLSAALFSIFGTDRGDVLICCLDDRRPHIDRLLSQALRPSRRSAQRLLRRFNLA
jgi:hypothetical protein